MTSSRKAGLLRFIGPGLLVAATGVGAGDLATGAFSGSVLGTVVLWAALLGALLKFVLTEGLTRWQLATGETVLEGALSRMSRPLRWLFLVYLIPWSWFVGGALISACGVTLHAMFPVFEEAENGKIAFGIVASMIGLALVELGGFKVFEKVMSISIGVMFVTVLVTAALLRPDWGAVLRGTFWPTIPDADGQGVAWTMALIGGVGGTLTILCYGYWIREHEREGLGELRLCRIDLAIGYVVTALFCLAMVVIGSTIQVDGSGAGLVVSLANRLEEPLGPVGRWVFLVGALATVFSSLLGVWQAVPFVFADFWRLARGRPEASVDPKAAPYQVYLFALAFIPLSGLAFSFKEIAKYYAIVGALFMPLLAVVLLVLNGRRAWVGKENRNGPVTVILLTATLGFFVYAGWLELARKFGE